MSAAADPEAFYAHLGTGVTSLCWAWAVTRADGVTYGFTDHDRDLAFEGVTFRAGTGLSAAALMQTTGLAVDNTEALGALSDAAVREEDLAAGRFDGAEVRAWLVNWHQVSQRLLQFSGTIGQIRQGDGQFHAELRGLTEGLNQSQGRIFHADCSAVLGDGACHVDLGQPGYSTEVAVETVEDARRFDFAQLAGFDDRWFERGRLEVLSGAAAGLSGTIKNDRLTDQGRAVALWQGLGIAPAPGDLVRLEAGCDKRAETCRLKFHNFPNFRGFPHIPGEDWLAAYPVSGGANDGGALK